MNAIVSKITAQPPVYDFTAPDGFGHHFWTIENDADITRITELFADIPYLYIADGHHRTAAAALVGAEKAQQNPHHQGDEGVQLFLGRMFPASQLNIIDYNRVVKDLNGLSNEEFLSRLSENFIVEEKGNEIYKLSTPAQLCALLNKKCYSLTAKEGNL